jgi:regulatory protein
VTENNPTAPEPERRLARALELAYRYLNRRDRTTAQMRRHLASRGVDEPAIDGAVAALARERHLDDTRYARTFAEDRRALDGWGPERIQHALLAAGVDAELVAAALGGRDASDELDAAMTLLRRRWREVPTSDRERERARGLLVRKGYELELAYEAVRAFERAAASRETHARTA